MDQSEGRTVADQDLPLQLAQAQQQIVDLKISLEEARASLVSVRGDAERHAENARLAQEEMQHFVYAVSHDLRQPLRGVLTSAQLLERQTDIKDRIEEFTSSIVQGAVEMNSLIERLLTYSRVASNLRRTIVPLSPVVQWALMSMADTVTDAGAKVTYEDLPTVDVDESSFATLFQQLFTNSILYCGANAPKIHVSSEERDEEYIISVRDNACGVKEEFHERIFAPFHRLHGHDIPGFGLGLSISRKIVRAHGGKIWVESDGSSGSTFRFSIPA